MVVIPSGLQGKYEEYADALITQVNKTPMTLYYDTDAVTTGVVDNLSPMGYDLLGGRTPIHDQQDLSDASGASVEPVAASSVITVRAYWESRKDNSEAAKIHVRDQEHWCKVISFATDVSSLRNAQYAIINNEKVTMVRDATYHGMFGNKKYATTYWEINE